MRTELKTVVRQRRAGVNMSVDVDVEGALTINLLLSRADERLPRIDTIAIEPSADGEATVVICRQGTPTDRADLENLHGAQESSGHTLGWVYVRPESNHWGHHWVTDADIRHS